MEKRQIFRWILGLAMLTFSLSAEAAFPPSKPHVCMAMFRQFAITRPELLAPENTYVLNSLGAFRRNVLKVEEIQGGIPEGFARSSGAGRGLSRKKAAARIAGIEEFAKTSEGADPAKRQFTKTISISGKENIQTFLKELRQNVEILEDALRQRNLSVNVANTFHVAAALAAPEVVKFLIYPHVSVGDVFAVAILATNLKLGGIEFTLRQPSHWDFRVLKQIDLAMQAVEKPKGWALISRNYQMNPKVVEGLQVAVDDDVFAAQVKNQTMFDENPRVMRKQQLKENPAIAEREWVGLDMLFESNAAGEPELHVVMRGSQQPPIFPKPASKKQNGPKESLTVDPATVPGLAPAARRPE